MELIIIILFSLSIILFVLSFFRKDRVKQLEKQMDQLSITYMQEIYQLKKKIRLLEEELLISPRHSFDVQHKNEADVIDLFESGNDLRTIASKTNISLAEVEHILQKAQK
ncbi:hypothetical protein N0O92_16080 [Alkalihalobacillus sp. MEB130]|uniref:hypothetical protein n=1 Tax=Alkalihalobacillus sp. MEB130 TaxID=2976704 RepID=UPI0028DF39A4|nr:hypothetical protein [Alkalihalobacillus sp. MEB130]MDT8861737.1 hypothetical protein [Alkalihalobacillus sp. MEB130]